MNVQRRRRGVAVTVLTATLLFATVPGWVGLSGASNTTIYVTPTGVDDTPNIQAALDACDLGCTIWLAAGTYHVAQLVASDLHGAVRGAGREKTVIEPLPQLRVSDDVPSPFLQPPTSAKPWPSLITFIDGSFAMSDLSIRIIHSPSAQPWHFFDATAHELMAVMVSGVHADASFERLAFEGAPGTWNGYSNLFSIIYSGQLLRAGGSDSRTTQPLSGS